MRNCDAGICKADAVAVAKYTKPNSETCTKAACSKVHAEEIEKDMEAQGYLDLTWVAMPKTEKPEWVKP